MEPEKKAQDGWKTLKDAKFLKVDEKGRWHVECRIYPTDGRRLMTFHEGMVRVEPGGEVQVSPRGVRYQDKILHRRGMLAQVWTTDIHWR